MKDMKNNIFFQIVSQFHGKAFLPTDEQAVMWIQHGLVHTYPEIAITLALVDAHDMATLNINFREKPGPTNVLTFLDSESEDNLHGDIVICPTVVQQEAAEQGISEAAHFAHLFIHGLLHLQGYDHIEEEEAVLMEDLEQQILANILPTLKKTRRPKEI
jgi:probable rRNA maturation factor